MNRFFFTITCILFLFSCTEKTKPVSTVQIKRAPFSKIIFHTSSCFGCCSVYHLEVDSDKTFKLYAEKVYKKDAMLMSDTDSSLAGYYKGIVNDTTFNELTKQIQTIGIDTLDFGNSLCCDGSTITLIIYHDGKRKFLQSMTVPEPACKVTSPLFEICEKGKMEKTNKKFTIEYSDK